MPQCTFWDARRLFLCMPDPDDPGHGCDVGCNSCLQDVIGPQGVSSGNRFLRPWAEGHPPGGFQLRVHESRDANGVNHYLDTAEPWRYGTHPVRQEVAQCWSNDGTEFFLSDICDCNAQCSGLPGPFVLEGRMGTCYIYHGHDWPPDPEIRTMLCLGRDSPQDSPIQVDMGGGFLDQATSMRLPGTPQPEAPFGCTSDYMVPCAGFREESQCGQGALEEYAGRAAASRFDFINVISHNIGLAAPTDADPSWVASIAAGDAALTYIMNTLQPGQINSRRRLNPGNQNFALSRYTFEFAPEDWFADGPVVATFTGSRVLAAGCPVTAEYIIKRANLDIALVIEDEDPHDLINPPPAPDHIVRPLFRVEVRADMALRVRLPAPCTYTRTWTDPNQLVTVTLRDSTIRRGPIVLTNGIPDIDSILYIDAAGRRFDPLMRVRWVGQLGYLTFPIATNLVAAGVGIPNCQEIVNAMSSIAIPAVSSHLGVPSGSPGSADPGPATSDGQSERGIIHTGLMTLGFPAWP